MSLIVEYDKTKYKKTGQDQRTTRYTRQTGLIDALMQINPINLVVLRELLQR